MPIFNFRFCYKSEIGYLTHEVKADTPAEALVRRNDYLGSIKGEYLSGSMQVLVNDEWQDVPEVQNNVHRLVHPPIAPPLEV